MPTGGWCSRDCSKSYTGEHVGEENLSTFEVKRDASLTYNRPLLSITYPVDDSFGGGYLTDRTAILWENDQ